MLKFNEQLSFSDFEGIYDRVVPKEHLLRKIKENIDFSFVNPLLKDSYSEKHGRPAKEPEKMFKLLFLKSMYEWSDRQLMEHAGCNMAIKYFLDINPEDEVPDASLMTIFRRTRIKDEETLEVLLGETVKQAVEKGLVKSTSIFVDATHTQSKSRKETPTQMLRRKTKALRKVIHQSGDSIAMSFPEKPSETAELAEEIAYTEELLKLVENYVENSKDEKLKGKYKSINELVESDEIKNIQSAVDQDARTGYKSESNDFFGYKSHIAINDERLITAIEVTSGEAPDGKFLKNLVEKSEKVVKVEEVVGDAAYSGKDNIELAKEKEFSLVSRLNPSISNAATKKDREDGFEYIKDADTFRCPAGHLSIRKARQGKKGEKKNQVIAHYFDVKKCKTCPMKEGCYKEGAKSKSYSITIMSDEHKSQLEFENSEYFQERIKTRYIIEAKNGELKQNHGLRHASYLGLFGMTIQSYVTACVSNCKRIVTLIGQKNEKTAIMG